MNNQVSDILKLIFVAVLIALAISFAKTAIFSTDEHKTPAKKDNIMQEYQSEKPISKTKMMNKPTKRIQAEEKQKEKTQIINLQKNILDEETRIRIKPLKSLSGLNAKEIIEMRKNAVNNSVLFSGIKNYQPKSNVFLIEDGLQWISAHEISCNGVENNPNIGKGLSRESLGILNPELMFYVSIPNFAFRTRGMECSTDDYLLPYKVTYTKSNNTIHAYFKYEPLRKKMGYFSNVVLSDANAHDFGYDYVFANKYSNIRFKVNKFNTGVIKTRGFYHKGYSCGLSEGCNNYSPFEEGYEFYIQNLPASIQIKLWKNNPSDTYNVADLNYELIFE